MVGFGPLNYLLLLGVSGRTLGRTIVVALWKESSPHRIELSDRGLAQTWHLHLKITYWAKHLTGIRTSRITLDVAAECLASDYGAGMEL